MGAIVDHMRRKALAVAQAMAERYAEHGIMAGAKVAPVPGKAPYATGRSLESLQATNSRATTYDPGVKGSYKRPTRVGSKFYVKLRRPHQAVVIAMGVTYDWNVERLYHVIATAHQAGINNIKANIDKIDRKAAKAVGTTRIK